MLRSVVASRAPRRAAAVVLLTAVTGTVLLAGCGAGQQAQTAAKDPSVPGVNATVQGISLRNVQVTYPDRERRGYPQGGTAPLEVRIFNSGTLTDTLVAVRSDAAEQVVLNGSSGNGSEVCPQGTVSVTAPQPTASPSEPASPQATPSGPATGNVEFSIKLTPGQCALLLPGNPHHLALTGLREALAPGTVVPVTFTFREAGEVTVNVPFGLPTDGPEHSPLDIHPSEPPAVGGHDTGGGHE